MWVASKDKTEKIPYLQVRDVASDPIHLDESYHILVRFLWFTIANVSGCERTDTHHISFLGAPNRSNAHRPLALLFCSFTIRAEYKIHAPRNGWRCRSDQHVERHNTSRMNLAMVFTTTSSFVIISPCLIKKRCMWKVR